MPYIQAVTRSSEQEAVGIFGVISKVWMEVKSWFTTRPLTFEELFVQKLRRNKDAVIDTEQGYITLELKEYAGEEVVGIVNERGKVKLILAP